MFAIGRRTNPPHSNFALFLRKRETVFGAYAPARAGLHLYCWQKTSPMNRRLRVLFVCAMNKQRSLTADHLYRNDARLEVRSAGVRSEASRRVSEEDLRWADVVFATENEHKLWISTRFEDLDLP